MQLLKSPSSSGRPRSVVCVPGFTVDAAIEGDTHVIQAKGELDLFDRPRLERALEEAESGRTAWILLDLEELTFIDAAGLYTLLTASRRSACNGRRLRVTRGKGDVARMLRMSGLDTSLPFADLPRNVGGKCVIASATVSHG